MGQTVAQSWRPLGPVGQDNLTEWPLCAAPGAGDVAVNESGGGLARREPPLWFRQKRQRVSGRYVQGQSWGAALAKVVREGFRWSKL